MWFTVVLVTALAATATQVSGQAQEEFASDCPAPNGFFADAFQCDKYYSCKDNLIEEKLCPDGMAFNDLNPRLEKCDFHFQVDCTERPEFQTPLGDANCPHANGYFPHPDPLKCNVFSYCSAGVASVITCPQDLVFSMKTGTCTWPDQSGRVDCDSKAVLNFTCPKEDLQTASAHPRYADPQDCQFFFVCISGVTPRHNGCKFGEVFSGETKACDAPNLVPECEKYYWDYFAEYFETLGTGSTRTSSEVIEAALKSNYPVPENAKIRLTKPRINSANRQRKPQVTASAPASPARTPVRTSSPISPARTPVRTSSPISPARSPIAAAPEQQVAPVQAAPKPQRPQAGDRPVRRRRPAGQGIRRRKTTTTTPAPPTTTAEPEYYYDYEYSSDYYVDEPAAQPAEPAPAPVTNTPRFRNLNLRFNPKT